MKPDQRNRITDLYHRALACAPEERSAFLKAATDGDELVRQEVESLLACDSGFVGFLDRPVAELVAGRFMHADRVGRQLGPYTILAPLGVGGMGEVYRAHDSKLGRDVAIKILQPQFTVDPERRARFAREARLLATLNHPHVGAIYGLEEADDVNALVLELVEGPTLADRLGRGPMSMVDALTLARQIAEGLSAAHEKGIVHRDLKPANIVLQQTGGTKSPSGQMRAKVLDFGLAKMMTARVADDPTAPPWRSDDGTLDGRILGTPAYMSPEQVRGEAVDRRADIWAFGCVLFEMLTGHRAFDGNSAPDTFASILEREPDWSLLPRETAPPIRTLLQRCLRKTLDKRLHDIADARIELEEVTSPTGFSGSPARGEQTTRRGRERLGWIVAAALALLMVVVALLTRRDVQSLPAERLEFSLAPPGSSRFIGSAPEFAISPNGRYVVFAASSKAGSSLWIHSLANLEVRELSGTDGARSPFWSPNSESIGFFAHDQLKTVQVNGGSPVALCPAPGTSAFSLPHSGTWNDQGVIVFAQHDGLRQVSATGGPSTAVALAQGDNNPAWPWFLPDGRHFLYLLCCRDKPELRVGSIATRDTVSLGRFESHAQYAANHLFFVRGGNLMAQPFDEETLQLKGQPLHLGIQAGVNPAWDHGVFSVSTGGRLVYRATARPLSQLTWLDRRGVVMESVGEPGVINNLELSPDGRSVAFAELTHQQGSRAQFDIWVRDLTTGRVTRLTDDPAWEFGPAWSPDGAHVAFISNRPLPSLRFTLFMRASDGSGHDIPLVTSPTEGPDWGRHGIIIYHSIAGYHGIAGTDTGIDLWTLPMLGDRRPTAFLSTKHNESHGRFSPDGRWIAFQSNASGRDEVYVRRFPSKDPSYRVSRDGGTKPYWRGDGKELFFLSSGGLMMAARIDTTDGFTAGVPQPLYSLSIASGKEFVVTSDGQRFLIPMERDEPLRVVLDWRALISR